MQASKTTVTIDSRQSDCENVIHLAARRKHQPRVQKDTDEPAANEVISQILQDLLREIEISASIEFAGSAKGAFLIAALRAAPKAHASHQLHLKNIINTSGYSRATFFRVFGSNHAFRTECYSVFSTLAASAIDRLLRAKKRTAADFAMFASSAIYCAFNFLLLPLYEQQQKAATRVEKPSQDTNTKLSAALANCLYANSPTRHLQISIHEIGFCLRAIETDLLDTRPDHSIDDQAQRYKNIRKIFWGMMLASDPKTFAEAH